MSAATACPSVKQRPAVDLVGRERGEPRGERGALRAPPDLLLEVLLDEPGRPSGVAGGQRVPDGVVGEAVLLVPGRGGAVQLGHAVGELALQVGAQEIGEQVVVAPPPPLLVERDQEQAGPLDRLQQLLAVRAAHHGVAQRPAQPVEDRGLQQERAQLGRLAFEHLLGEVVEHEAVAPGELGDEPGDVAAALQRQRREVQARRPALGALAERARRRRRTGATRPRCAAARAASPAVKRRSPARSSASWPRARSLASGSGGSLRLASTMCSAGGRWSSRNSHRPVHLGRLDHVVVVDHQRHVLGRRGELVHQRGDGGRERGGRRAGHDRTDAVGHAGAHAVERGRDVAPEPHRVVVARVERQPRHRPPVGVRPIGQQARLAEPRRPADQHELALRACLQLPDEPGTRHPARPRLRCAQFGCQQRIVGRRDRG